MNGNKLGLPAAIMLSKAICVNKTIRILDLSRNQVGAKGTSVLAEALSGMLCLKSLDLSYNEIGNSGARAISNLLIKVPLLELRIQGNKISSDGMIAIFQALSLLDKAKKN